MKTDRDSYFALKREQYPEEFIQLLGDEKEYFDHLWEEALAEKNALFVIEAENEAIAGFCLLQEIPCGQPEIAVTVFGGYRNRGAATEGVRQMLHIFCKETGVRHYTWKTFANQPVSIRVAEKLGGRLVNIVNFSAASKCAEHLAEKGVHVQEFPSVLIYELCVGEDV